MRTIILTKGKSTTVDDEDYEALSKFKWNALKGRNDTWWASRKKKSNLSSKWTTVLMHRVILNITGIGQVDHKDGNGLNNQRSNLRPASNKQNCRNRGINKNNRTGFKGVSWSSSRCVFEACIRVNYKIIHLGRFQSASSAAAAYDEAAIKQFGQFARTNKTIRERASV